jgi:DEAD/DEAH box helicase domain-containing protein
MQLDYMRLLRQATSGRQQQFEMPGVELTPVDLGALLSELTLWERTLPGQEADAAPIPSDLPKPLRRALRSQGITSLYSHQSKALTAIRKGCDVALTPPTASGKTLSAYIPILEGCLQQGDRAIAFYGMKALSADQSSKLNTLVESLDVRVAELTGDVSQEQRQDRMAEEPHIISLTPDLLHYQLRNVWRSHPWQEFLRKLRFILIDETHTYNSVYGANMALLLKRLLLTIERQGGDPSKVQFIFLSATCSNIREVATRLSGRAYSKDKKTPHRLVQISKSGAAVAEKRLVVTKPSYSVSADCAKLIVALSQEGKTGIVFVNSRFSTKRITQLVAEEDRTLAAQVAPFYGSLDVARRQQIVSQLESGNVRWIIATEALEAGIDLPILDCAILVGFPDSLMSFWQRVGRAGRKRSGMAIYIPIANNALNEYYTDEKHLLAPVESVHFNEAYPMLLARHLLCAAAESGLSKEAIVQYFGKDALPIAKQLLQQSLLHKGKNGYYAKGYPHRELNFRGGSIEATIKLVDASGTPLEEMPASFAYREAFPGAIYRTQVDGHLLTYKCQSLDLKSHRALMHPVDDPAETDTRFTIPQEQRHIVEQEQLLEPIVLPLQFSDAESSIELTLQWTTIVNQVQGYALYNRLYEQTCFNRNCQYHREPLSNQSHCPGCGRTTRKAELSQLIEERTFESPYETQLGTMALKLCIADSIHEPLKQASQELRRSLKGQSIPKGHQSLWDTSSTLIALHTVGHQLMLALPLVVKAVDQRELNFSIEKAGDSYYGIFYDQCEGGNGACENIFRNVKAIAHAAYELCSDRPSSEHLYQQGCPDGNHYLVNKLGLVVLNALLTF